MTTAQVRGSTLAHYRLCELLEQPLPDEMRAVFESTIHDIELACYDVTERSAPARWARDVLGPVLAAAVGSAAWLRGDVPNPTAALRIFGLAGEKALSPAAAWEIMQQFLLREDPAAPVVVAELQRQTGLRLNLPKQPSVADVLEELCRPRSAKFAVQVGHWLVDHFRETAGGDTFGPCYRASLSQQDGAGAISAACMPAGQLPTREEWGTILLGGFPSSRLETFAATTVARKFLVEYWERWNVRREKVG